MQSASTRIFFLFTLTSLVSLACGCEEKKRSTGTTFYYSYPHLSSGSVRQPDNTVNSNPLTQNREIATWNYWLSLKRIGSQFDGFEKETERAKSPDDIVRAFRKIVLVIQKVNREIGALSVYNVDQDATFFAAQMTEHLNHLASLIRDFADFIEEAKTFTNWSNSPEAGIEAFLRGVLGDPLGTFNDTRAEANRLEKQRLALQNRWSKLEEKLNAFDSTELKVRSVLSQRYNQDFPKLDNE